MPRRRHLLQLLGGGLVSCFLSGCTDLRTSLDERIGDESQDNSIPSPARRPAHERCSFVGTQTIGELEIEPVEFREVPAQARPLLEELFAQAEEVDAEEDTWELSVAGDEETYEAFSNFHENLLSESDDNNENSSTIDSGGWPFRKGDTIIRVMQWCVT